MLKPIINTQINSRNIPTFIRDLVAIVGAETWEKRILELYTLAAKGPHWKEYVFEHYAVELALADVSIRMESRTLWPPQSDAERRLFSYAAMVVQLYNNLSPKAKNKLVGSIKKDLNQKHGLGPTLHEMRIAVTLLTQNFQVEFSDLEDKARFDFLAKKDGLELEVECKFISADIGRQLHHYEVRMLADLVHPIARQAVTNKKGGYLIYVELNERLASNLDKQQKIASAIEEALLSEASCNFDEARIVVTKFDLETSPFTELRSKHVTKDEIRNEFCSKHGLDRNNEHIIFHWQPNKAAVVVALRSKKEDKMLRKMIDSLKDDSKVQFSRQNPGLLCVHIAGINNEQLLELSNAEKQGETTGVKVALNHLLDRRPYLHTVAIMADTMTSVDQQNAARIFRESSLVYAFSNTNHPQANHIALKDMFKKRSA